MAKHTVIKTIKHDGKLYRKGAEVDLSADEAKPLIAIGHVAEPEKAKK
jgi:hypothetical protein